MILLYRGGTVWLAKGLLGKSPGAQNWGRKWRSLRGSQRHAECRAGSRRPGIGEEQQRIGGTRRSTRTLKGQTTEDSSASEEGQNMAENPVPGGEGKWDPLTASSMVQEVLPQRPRAQAG